MLANARLIFILEDVWYMCLPNSQRFFRPLEYFSITLVTADRLRLKTIKRDRTRLYKLDINFLQ